MKLLAITTELPAGCTMSEDLAWQFADEQEVITIERISRDGDRLAFDFNSPATTAEVGEFLAELWGWI